MYNNGRLFEFENTYFYDPKEFGFVDVFQIGELSLVSGYEMVRHCQICHEISFVVSGEGTFYTDDEPLVLRAGEIHFVPRSHYHQIKVLSGQNLRFAYLGFNFNEKANTPELQDLERTLADGGCYHVMDNGNIRLMIYMLINEMYGRPAYSNIMGEAYINQIIVQLYRLLTAEHTSAFVPDTSKNVIGELIYSVLNYVDNHVQDITRIQDIGGELGYSHSYISHLFREKMGMTLHQYVTRKKIERSLELLATGKYSITDIALQLNYESVQSFGKMFKKIKGCTPSEYQKRLNTAQRAEQQAQARSNEQGV